MGIFIMKLKQMYDIKKEETTTDKTIDGALIDTDKEIVDGVESQDEYDEELEKLKDLAGIHI